ncbi:MAG: hypothetical protein AAB280_03840, partial [Pseudomonadota bacterium]
QSGSAIGCALRGQDSAGRPARHAMAVNICNDRNGTIRYVFRRALLGKSKANISCRGEFCTQKTNF